jgi:hypothetical protein
MEQEATMETTAMERIRAAAPLLDKQKRGDGDLLRS